MANELILVVEDNDKNRKLVRDVLTFKGYEIIEAETGEEGWARFSKAPSPPTSQLSSRRSSSWSSTSRAPRLSA